MEKISLNKTPLRTSVNYNINDIFINDLVIPEKVEKFNNINVQSNIKKNKIQKGNFNCTLTHGISDLFTNQVNKNTNENLKITINGRKKEEIIIDFLFDKDNLNLVKYIEIISNINTKATVILKYKTIGDIKAFNNLVIKTNLKEHSNVDVIIVNLMNNFSNNFISIENN